MRVRNLSSQATGPSGSIDPEERPWEDNEDAVVYGNLRYISSPNSSGALALGSLASSLSALC